MNRSTVSGRNTNVGLHLGPHVRRLLFALAPPAQAGAKRHMDFSKTTRTPSVRSGLDFQPVPFVRGDGYSLPYVAAICKQNRCFRRSHGTRGWACRADSGPTARPRSAMSALHARPRHVRVRVTCARALTGTHGHSRARVRTGTPPRAREPRPADGPRSTIQVCSVSPAQTP